MIEVRRLRADDRLDEVLHLCRAFFAEYESHHPVFFRTDNLTDDDIGGRFVASLDSDTDATIIALDDGDIVGYSLITIREQPRFYRVKKVGAMSGLMVAPSHRRRGLATRLIEESKRWFRARDIKFFTLYTAAANRDAMQLYERCGMTVLHTAFLGEL